MESEKRDILIEGHEVARNDSGVGVVSRVFLGVILHEEN